MPTLDKRELRLLTQARANLRKHGELSPVLIIDGEKSGVAGFDEFGPGEKGRRALRAAGRAAAKYKPWRVTLIVDTWIKTEDFDLSTYETGDLARDPSSAEGLLLATETSDGRRRFIYQLYEVGEDGKYTFEPPTLIPDTAVGDNPITAEFWRGVGQGAAQHG
jgi:hypothetical protein